MSAPEGPAEPLELSEVLTIHTDEGADVDFEVVGILEDPEEGTSYAVLMHEPHENGDGQFIVTDLYGNLLDDDALAQDVLDEFLVFAQEAGDDGGGKD